MKRKALLIGNTRGLKDTPLDLYHVAKYLISFQGGAWDLNEILFLPDKRVEEILKEVEKVKNEQNDYVIVYFTGHGGFQDNTIIEVNPDNELLKENSVFGLAERQLNVMDCCRAVQTTPLPFYGSSRGMSVAENEMRKKVREEYENLIKCAAPQIVRMYSCSEGESSYGTGKDGSYYTNNLLWSATELLKTNDVVRIYQCHEEAARMTAAQVQSELKMNQHPSIIPAKCIEQAELPFGFNPTII
jgi:CRISPR/Cas system CSM-associated protein Csm5 (group 7 of RAMP superfamily)